MKETVRIDTARAYALIRELLTTLALQPGSPINEQRLAADLEMGLVPIREALQLLAGEHLVTITPRHGPYVAEVNISDLAQLSEMRLTLESMSARLAAQRATPDDLIVLNALREEQASALPGDGPRLLEVDHRFHQAIAAAAHNKYLAEALERLFGLSQRLWYLALPQMGTLPPAVEMHLNLVQAIAVGDPHMAEQIMLDHVNGFYDEVRAILFSEQEDRPAEE